MKVFSFIGPPVSSPCLEWFTELLGKALEGAVC